MDDEPIITGEVPDLKKGEVPDLKPEQIIAPLSVFEEMTDDEILYWSTPYYDELMAQKELQKQAAKEEK